MFRRGRSPAPGWRRPLPRHAPALTVCALALLLGVAVADDYGVWFDAYIMRAIGEATLRHLAGENGLNLLWPPWNRLYGPVFETPLVVVERILDRDDSRSVFLSRSLLTHLFFIVTSFVAYLLAYRLFGSRWLALFALALFLLQPRIYGHSFFNSKDVPFLCLFTICLWLAHRAFGKKTGEVGDAAKGSVGAFALCGVAAGLMTNLRITGLVFVALVVLARLCDAVAAGGWGERRRAIAGGAAFALASVAAYYATMPYLWADPAERFMEMLAVLSTHPTTPLQLFQGERVLASELPASYLPVWFGITTPPLALLLGAFGLAALVWRCVAGPRLRVLLRNTPLRFELLVAACFVLPLLAAIVLRPTYYEDWRHFYFLWAPFVLLAVSGLRTLAGDAHRLGRTPRVAAVAGLATIGLLTTAVEMARLHPYQHLYFNVLANGLGAAKPLDQRFDLEDRFSAEHGYAHILDELAAREPPDSVFNVRLYTSARAERELARLGVAMRHRNLELFRQREQRRFKFDPNADFDFYVRDNRREAVFFPPVLYERRLYGREMVQVATPDLSRVDEATAEGYRALYRQVTSAAPAFGGDVDIDVYHGETAISWVREPCPPGGVNAAMDMTVVPLDATRGRYARRTRGVRVGDACLWQAPLPDQPFAKIILPNIGAVASQAHLEERRRRYATLAAKPPAAQSTFNVYLEDGKLFYVKTPCVLADTEATFFVHVRPAHLRDLPLLRRRQGFDALDFRFGGFDPHWRDVLGDIFDGVCLATLDLPYPVAGIATGQYDAGGAALWRADVGGG